MNSNQWVRPGRRVDFDANKKMRSAKCNTTPRKIPSLRSLDSENWAENSGCVSTGPIFKNQLTRTKVFFPGLKFSI